MKLLIVALEAAEGIMFGTTIIKALKGKLSML